MQIAMVSKHSSCISWVMTVKHIHLHVGAVLLAISAWLADRGFSLPRIGTLESEAQKENDKLAADGRLAHLKDITGNRGS
jgi:hypothetical protein